MGRALRNLDGLLRMPYGCGEQNMAQLAPNIYILQYLEKTQQLTPAVREKAVEFLRSGEGLGSSLCSSAVPLSLIRPPFLSSGYQRQLNYRNVSGAYSTFGVGVGNIW